MLALWIILIHRGMFKKVLSNEKNLRFLLAHFTIVLQRTPMTRRPSITGLLLCSYVSGPPTQNISSSISSLQWCQSYFMHVYISLKEQPASEVAEILSWWQLVCVSTLPPSCFGWFILQFVFCALAPSGCPRRMELPVSMTVPDLILYLLLSSIVPFLYLFPLPIVGFLNFLPKLLSNLISGSASGWSQYKIQL